METTVEVKEESEGAKRLRETYEKRRIEEEIGRFKNVAGKSPDHCDYQLGVELNAAGITIQIMPMVMDHPEVKTKVFGTIGNHGGWNFSRNWSYWVVNGPGLPLEYALELYDTLGSEVRVGGDCGCGSPELWYEGNPVTLYHVDTQRGLNALAKAIKQSMAHGMQLIKNYVPTIEKYR